MRTLTIESTGRTIERGNQIVNDIARDVASTWGWEGVTHHQTRVLREADGRYSNRVEHHFTIHGVNRVTLTTEPSRDEIVWRQYEEFQGAWFELPGAGGHSKGDGPARSAIHRIVHALT